MVDFATSFFFKVNAQSFRHFKQRKGLLSALKFSVHFSADRSTGRPEVYASKHPEIVATKSAFQIEAKVGEGESKRKSGKTDENRSDQRRKG